MRNIEKMLFEQHRHTAKTRSIPFKFTIEQWVAWWFDALGPDWIKKRGRCKGQFVMCRKGDKGPYAAWNVTCQTVEENSSEANRGKRKHGPRLTETDVLKIFQSEKANSVLAIEYRTQSELIGRIKSRETWAHLTKGLTSPPRRKGRRGANTHNAILTDEKVIEIRKSKRSKKELAALYGVHYNTICNVLSKRQWRHLL